MLELVRQCLGEYERTGRAAGRNKAIAQIVLWLKGYYELIGEDKPVVAVSFSAPTASSEVCFKFRVRDFDCALKYCRVDDKLRLVFESTIPDFHGLDGETMFIVAGDKLGSWETIYSDLRAQIYDAWRKEAETLAFNSDTHSWIRPHTGYNATLNSYGSDGWYCSVDDGKKAIGVCNPYETFHIADRRFKNVGLTDFWLINKSSKLPFWEFRCHYNVMHRVDRIIVDGEHRFFSRCRRPEGLTYVIKESRIVDAEVRINKLYAIEIDVLFEVGITNTKDISAIECFLKYENTNKIIKSLDDIK